MNFVQTYQQQLQSISSNGIELGTDELLYYQGFTKLLDLSPKSRVKAHLSGGYASSIKGRGMEFDEARHYQPGDDIRAIDWRVTARTGKTHTKVYREERERPVFVVCDLSSSMQFGTQLLFKSIQAAHFASLLGWSAIDRGDKLGAIVFNNVEHVELKPKTRKRAVLSLFHALTDIQHKALQSSNKTDTIALESSLMRTRRLARPGSTVYIISDFEHFNEQCAKYVSDIRRHCEVQSIEIHDPIEQCLPTTAAGRRLTLQPSGSNETITIGSRASYQAYSEERAKKQHRLSTLLKPHVSSHLELSAGTLLLDQLNPISRGSR
jgi:uncharacterized protein (DUF58 family)